MYSHDERHGTNAAKIIFEKGFDNIYLLTGSISVFAYENHALIEGSEVPSLKELQQQHYIATQKAPEQKNMQSSKGFTKRSGMGGLKQWLFSIKFKS